MKTTLLVILASFGLAFTSCRTAGYAAGRTMEKTGHVVAHGGHKVMEHTQ